MTTFHRARIGSTTVATAYTAGSGSLVVADGAQFGTTYPLLVIASRAGVRLSTLEVTARSTNTLTIAGAVDGTTDVNLVVGDAVKEGPCALHVNELQDAVNAVDAAAVHVTGAEAIAGDKTFSGVVTVAGGSDSVAISSNFGAGPGVMIDTATHGAYVDINSYAESWINYGVTTNSSGSRVVRIGSAGTTDSWRIDLLSDDSLSLTTAGIFRVALAAPATSLAIDPGGTVTIGTGQATLQGDSSTPTRRDVGHLASGFDVTTDASYTGWAGLDAHSYAGREYGVRVDSTGSGANVSLFVPAAGSYGGGIGVLFLPNRSAAPTGSPTGGGVLYAEGGALKWKGSGGTITTLGSA